MTRHLCLAIAAVIANACGVGCDAGSRPATIIDVYEIATPATVPHGAAGKVWITVVALEDGTRRFVAGRLGEVKEKIQLPPYTGYTSSPR